MKNRLEEIRKSRGITQEELANILEVSRQTIGSLENGRYNPSIILAFKIAKFFNLTIEDIFIYEEEEMNRSKSILKDWILVFFGVALVLTGFYLHKRIDSVNKTVLAIPYLFIGIGCGVFGHFMGNIIKYFSTKNNKELIRQLEIDKKDERNVLIAEKSKAKAYDLMTYLFAAMLIMFSLMGVDKLQIIILVAIYLSIQIYAVFWRSKFEKEM